MSYNILAQDLMQQSSELYLHCHPDILNWNYRFANLMQEFQHWDPDVSEKGEMPFGIGARLGLFSDAIKEEFKSIVQMITVTPSSGACLLRVF